MPGCDDDDDDVTAFFAQMLDAAAPVAGAAADDASAARQDGAERIIAFALEAWNHNSLALALLHAAQGWLGQSKCQNSSEPCVETAENASETLKIARNRSKSLEIAQILRQPT